MSSESEKPILEPPLPWASSNPDSVDHPDHSSTIPSVENSPPPSLTIAEELSKPPTEETSSIDTPAIDIDSNAINEKPSEISSEVNSTPNAPNNNLSVDSTGDSTGDEKPSIVPAILEEKSASLQLGGKDSENLGNLGNPGNPGNPGEAAGISTTIGANEVEDRKMEEQDRKLNEGNMEKQSPDHRPSPSQSPNNDDDDPAPLLIDSRGNSPTNLERTIGGTTTSTSQSVSVITTRPSEPLSSAAATSVSTPPPIEQPLPPVLRPQSGSVGSQSSTKSSRTPSTSANSSQRESPIQSTMRHPPVPAAPVPPAVPTSAAYYQGFPGTPTSTMMHPPACFPPPLTSAGASGIVLPQSFHQQHYGLLTTASPFGHGGGGQTIILNQFGQPVGVVSPSPAAAAASVHSSSPTAGIPSTQGQGLGHFPIPTSMHGQQTSSMAANNRSQQPLIMAYRQPGNIQQQQQQSAANQQHQSMASSMPMSMGNGSASSSSAAAAQVAANTAAAAAMAAAGMHSIPMFHNPFNPFGACNSQSMQPIYLPSGQMVIRTPTGQLLGFQVPPMPSHHQISMDHQLQQQQSQHHHHHSVPLAPSHPVTKYPQVLPKPPPMMGASAGAPLPPQQQQYTAIGPFSMPPPAVVPQLPMPPVQQPPTIAAKAPSKNVPILPTPPMGGATSQDPADPSMKASDRSINAPQPQPPPPLQPMDSGPLLDVVGLGPTAKDTTTRKPKTNPQPPLIAGMPPSMASNGGGKAPKLKRTKDHHQGKRESTTNKLGGKMKDVCVIDDDPGPLRVFSTEHSQQVAIEIHEMFERAWAQEKAGVGPPQILTHVIDGYVIQESMDPFPISPHPFDDFNISSIVTNTDALSELSGPPKLSPACGDDRSSASSGGGGGSEDNQGTPCANCEFPMKKTYAKSPAYCSKFCFKSAQRANEKPSAISTSARHDSSSSSLAQSIGSSPPSTSAATSPKHASPKQHHTKEKRDSGAPGTSAGAIEGASGGLLKVATQAAANEPSFSEKRPEQWSVQDVHDWISSLDPSVAAHARLFQEQEIDGSALLLLNEKHLISKEEGSLNMKFGPALKLCAALKMLKR